MKLKASEVTQAVRHSLLEDIGSGDITAELIHDELWATATVITREQALIAGQAWVEEVYRQLDPSVSVYWMIPEGGMALPDQAIVRLRGLARSLLTGERVALNWLQTLSGMATQTRLYVQALTGFKATLLDTRKTLPGLRYASKYAVACAGGQNHRMGLYDAFLIKENHIQSCGSILKAVQKAHELYPGKLVEVEVENLVELQHALQAEADIVMLDNFTISAMRQAVELNKGQAKLEVSGNVSLSNIRLIASTGVDFISVGGLTKHLRAIDLSMRLRSSISVN